MSDATRPSDPEITAMLLERSAGPVPGDLGDAVVARVREERDRDRQSARNASSRWLSLLVAAALVLGTGIALTSQAGSPRTAPSADAPALVAVQVGQEWQSGGGLAFTIRRDSAVDEDYYWRAATFDRILLTSLEQTDERTVEVVAGSPLLAGTAEDPRTRPGLLRFAFTVFPGDYRQPTMVSPATPVRAGENVRLTTIGENGFFGSIERDRPGSNEYDLVALTPIRGNGEGELNDAALRAAGSDYSPEIKARFLGVEPGSLGPNARALRDRIRDGAASGGGFDLAQQAEKLLRFGDFRYSTDVRHLDCGGLSTAECLATFKEGYCQYYAITMAVILRDLGVPTRIAQGFLPGSRAAGIEQIPDSNAHAWVEVYFPGYGWVMFDPTPRSFPGQAPPLPDATSTGSR